MYARTVKGRNLTLGVSGMLWEGSLVMIDEETKSLWAHMLGKAMRGPLTGTALTAIPSVMTDWKSWKNNHRETTLILMSRTTEQFTTGFHFVDSGLVIGLATKGRSRNWAFSDLYRHPVVNDLFGKTPVLVAFHKPSFAAIIYDRNIDGRVLTFKRKHGRLIDHERGCQWNLFTGEALTESLKGKRLKKLNGVVSDAAAWDLYHPINDSTWSDPTDGLK